MKLSTVCAECLSLWHCPSAMPRRPCKGAACLASQYTCSWWTRLTRLPWCFVVGQCWFQCKYLSPSQKQKQLRYISTGIHPEELDHSEAAPSTWPQSCLSVAIRLPPSKRWTGTLCSCVVGDLPGAPGRWPWNTFMVLMRPIFFLLHGDRVHQMAQRSSNFKRVDKEQMFSTHYIFNFIFY